MRFYDFLNPSVNFMGPGCVKVLGERCGANYGLCQRGGVACAGI